MLQKIAIVLLIILALIQGKAIQNLNTLAFIDNKIMLDLVKDSTQIHTLILEKQGILPSTLPSKDLKKQPESNKYYTVPNPEVM